MNDSLNEFVTLQRSSEGTAFNQLRSTAEGIRNSGAAIGGVNPRETLNQCLTLAIDAIRKLQQHGSENEPRITGETAQDAEVSSGGKSAHVNFRLHCDAYEVNILKRKLELNIVIILLIVCKILFIQMSFLEFIGRS